MTKVYFLFDIEGEYSTVLSIDLDLEILRTARDMCVAQGWSSVGLNLKDYKLQTFEQLGGVQNDGFMSFNLVRNLNEEQWDEISAEVPICLSQAGVEQLHVGVNGSVTVELSNETNEFSESLDLDDLLAFTPGPVSVAKPRLFHITAHRSQTFEQTASVDGILAHTRKEARDIAMSRLKTEDAAITSTLTQQSIWVFDEIE